MVEERLRLSEELLVAEVHAITPKHRKRVETLAGNAQWNLPLTAAMEVRDEVVDEDNDAKWLLGGSEMSSMEVWSGEGTW